TRFSRDWSSDVCSSDLEGIFWGYLEGGRKISFRSCRRENKSYLIAVGEPHKTGQSKDYSENFRSLESFLGNIFDIGEVTCYWSRSEERRAGQQGRAHGE